MVAAARAAGVEVSLCDIAGERLDVATLPKADVVTALWNVLGHIAGEAARVRTLQRMRALAHEGGLVILDVNDPHDGTLYGRARAARNAVMDVFQSAASGDFVNERPAVGHTVATTVHLFTVDELEGLLAVAGLGVIELSFFDYDTGVCTSSQWRGQICVVAEAG
jgi:hypothetical protein